jgi:transcriptional regulator with XRE-family HTH domain
MKKTTLAQFLAQKRQESGLSYAQVAERLGITPDRVEAWETTDETPPANLLMDLIQALNIDELDMFEVLTQDSMERWRSVLLALSGNRRKNSG